MEQKHIVKLIGTVVGNTMTDYVVHPCFVNGAATGYVNGEWDKELSGIWVAKFQASRSDATAEDGGSSNTLRIRPDILSWYKQEVGEAFTKAYNYNRQAESHLMKNSEWGAVLYLAHSIYGRNGTQIGTDYEASTTEEWLSLNSYKVNKDKSTTGNVYGIYDMAAYTMECVAGYVAVDAALGDVSNGTGAGLVLAGKTAETDSTKYVTIYPKGANETMADNYLANRKFGDAIYETSNDAYAGSSWFKNICAFPDDYLPYFYRGGGMVDVSKTGAFAFNSESISWPAFRVILAP